MTGLVVFFALWSRVRCTMLESSTAFSTQREAAGQLIARILPSHHTAFVLGPLATTATKTTRIDAFALSGNATHIFLNGTSGVALARGFHVYLRRACQTSVAWGAASREKEDLSVFCPPQLPVITVSQTVQSQLRYYLNVCAASYSQVWWTWPRWERAIDWMAMQGINLPLAFTGAEYIMRELFLQFGVPRDEIARFFSGPAFLAWHRMGNLRAWGGPLSDEWIDAQAALQRRILERQRSLGMMPVLPGFAGFVPDALRAAYPEALIERSSQWWETPNKTLCCNSLLRPEEPLWTEMGVAYYKLLAKEYGTDHIYSCDMFNEMTPKSDDHAYLRDTTSAVINAMRQADPKAVWLMQGWLFYAHQRFWRKDVVRAYLSGVPDDALIVLDLMAEHTPIWRRTEAFFGKPFIWCMLHNFGDVRGMYGNLTHIATAPVVDRALVAELGGRMVGTGTTMEAIEHNPVIYDLMNDVAWEESIDTATWLTNYVTRRYGVNDSKLQRAWRHLHASVYGTRTFAKSFMEADPMIEMQKRTIGWFWLHDPHRIDAIDTTVMVKAWRDMAKAANSGVSPRMTTLSYDLVDLGRQAMANLFFDVHVLFEFHFHLFVVKHENHPETLKRITTTMLDMILQTDALLATNPNHLLGTWVDDARSWAPHGDARAAEQLQFNALNLITLWGPGGEICDYSSRPWAGLYKTYYYERWKLLTERVMHYSETGTPKGGYRSDLIRFRAAWGRQTKENLWATRPTGDVLAVTNALVDRFAGSNKSPLRAGYRATWTACTLETCEVLIFATRLRLWTRDEHQLMFLCNLVKECAGVDMNGVMWKRVGNVTMSEDWADTKKMMVKIAGRK